MALHVQLFDKTNLNEEGSLFKLELDGITDMTVKQVKQKIEEEKNVLVENQRLFCAGVELTNKQGLQLV